MRIYICDHCGKVLHTEKTTILYDGDGKPRDVCMTCFQELTSKEKYIEDKTREYRTKYLTSANNAERFSTDDLLAEYVRAAVKRGEIKLNVAGVK